MNMMNSSKGGEILKKQELIRTWWWIARVGILRYQDCHNKMTKICGGWKLEKPITIKNTIMNS